MVDALLQERYRAVRAATEALVRGLAPEDLQAQSMPDASPLKWHLAHTAWFFEHFVLGPAGVPPFAPQYGFLFNSYYESVGAHWERPERGLLTRPTVDEVLRYRHAVDARMAELPAWPAALVELGLQHEQQHQELMRTDVKHLFARNPLEPTLPAGEGDATTAAGAPAWISFAEGVRAIGHDGDGFAFDNERPRHRQLLPPFALASRLVTAGEYAAFIADGGYGRAELWLSDGWATVQAERWQRPMYWRDEGGGRFSRYTLDGRRDVRADEPLVHVSFYEADAYARWADARLPTEAEWETAATSSSELQQLFGVGWQWTASAYGAYPGYRPPAGALGEYNGKFMCNQLVLRGSSRATPEGHARPTYRNFFPPSARWQLTAIRLAR